MDKNNYLPAVIVFCLTVLVLSAGYVILNKTQPIPIQQPAQTQPQQPQKQIKPNYQHHHHNNNFWLGYQDGWHNLPNKYLGPAYQEGYQLGKNERRNCHHHYYNDHCPDSFKLKLPKFQLEIR